MLCRPGKAKAPMILAARPRRSPASLRLTSHPCPLMATGKARRRRPLMATASLLRPRTLRRVQAKSAMPAMPLTHLSMSASRTVPTFSASAPIACSILRAVLWRIRATLRSTRAMSLRPSDSASPTWGAMQITNGFTASPISVPAACLRRRAAKPLPAPTFPNTGSTAPRRSCGISARSKAKTAPSAIASSTTRAVC